MLAAAFFLLPACAGPPPRPVERITGACPLLTSLQTGFYLDPSLIPVESNFGGVNETLYSCTYMRGKQVVVDFVVREFPSRGVDPTNLILSVGRRSRAETTPIAGVGDAAIQYDEKNAGVAVLVAVKRSGPNNLRLISFDAVKPFSGDRLAALGAIAMARL